MNKNITAADKARSMLRAAGYTQRQISVRQDHSSVRVTIRDATVSLYKVQEIVGPLENIRRCEVTGEILGGGNTYLYVNYLDAVIAPYLAAAHAAIESVPPGRIVRIGFHAVYQSPSHSASWDVIVHTSTMMENGRTVCAHGLGHGLEQAVVDNIARGAYLAAAAA